MKFWKIKKGCAKVPFTDEQIQAMDNSIKELQEQNKKLSGELEKTTLKNQELENKFVENTSNVGKFKKENIGAEILAQWKDGK